MTGHVRQRSPGSWEIRYFLGADPATGKANTPPRRCEAARKTPKRNCAGCSGPSTGEHVDPAKITVREWLATWLAAVREEVAPKTHERYSEIVNNYLAPALGNLQLAKLAPVHLQKAYSNWSTGGRRDGKPGGLSPRSRRHFHRILSAAFARAVEQQLIGRNPCDAFRKRLPKVERKEMVARSIQQSQRLLDAIRHTRVYWPVLIELATGARRGEILALRWKNIGDTGTVRIVESLEQTRAGLRFKPPKSGKARAVTLPAFALHELRRWKREQAEELLRLGVRQTGETLVCARADGLRMQPRSLTHEFTVLMAGVKDLPRARFHDGTAMQPSSCSRAFIRRSHRSASGTRRSA